MSRPCRSLLVIAVLAAGPAAAVRALPPPSRALAAEPSAAGRDLYGDPLPDGALARLGTARFRDGGSLSAAALSPDGKVLAVAGQRGVIRLWDAATGRQLRQFPGQFINTRALAFCPDGRSLAAADVGGSVRLLDPDSGRELRQFPMTPGGEVSFAFSADGKVLASGSGNFGQKVVVHAWDVTTGKQLAEFEPLQNMNVRVAVSPDGRVVASWGQYISRVAGIRAEDAERVQTVQLWDVAAGKELRRLRATTEPAAATAAAFAPDGKSLVTASNGSTLTVWDLATGKPAGRSGLGSFVAFAPDGRTLAAGGQAGWVQCWDLATGKRLGLYEGPAHYPVQAGFTRDGHLVAWSLQGQSLALWDVRAGKPLSPAEGHPAAVSGLVFVDGGREIISSSSEGTVCFWEARTGTEKRRLRLASDNYPVYVGLNRFSGVMISPDGKYLLTGGLGAVMGLRESATGREVCALPGLQQYPAPPAAFSPDGRLVATGRIVVTGQNRAAAAGVWDVDTGRELQQLQPEQGNLHEMAFAPDGRSLAAVAQYNDPAQGNALVAEVYAWEVATGKRLFRVKAGSVNAQGLAFSPDGRLLAFAGQGRGISLLDAAGGKEVRSFPAAGNVSWTTPPVFSPDGRVLAVGAQQLVAGETRAGVQLWEVASGALRQELTGHDGGVSVLAFAPDGSVLASGGADTTLLLWDLTGRPAGGAAPARLPPEELDGLWSDLAGDAGKAYRAMRRLAAAPGDSLPFLRRRVEPARAGDVDEGAIARWVADLDSDDFAVRRKAARDLEQAGRAARAALRKALAEKPSAEMRRQGERLLERLDTAGPTPEQLAALRAVEVLERLATPEARELLEALAKGVPDAPLTEDARASLGRLAKRGATP